MFSLVNKDNEPCRLSYKSGSVVVFGKASNGPVFGSGHDLRISDKSNMNQSSYANIGCLSAEAQAFLARTYAFQVAEIEVLSLE
jgi:hypothetical protein